VGLITAYLITFGLKLSQIILQDVSGNILLHKIVISWSKLLLWGNHMEKQSVSSLRLKFGILSLATLVILLEREVLYGMQTITQLVMWIQLSRLLILFLLEDGQLLL